MKMAFIALYHGRSASSRVRLFSIPPYVRIYRMSSDNRREDAASILAGYQGRDHEFTEHRSSVVQVKASEITEFNKNVNGNGSGMPSFGNPLQDTQGPSTDVCSHTHEDTICDAHSPLNLSSCMQSNVPEPYNTTPTHLNMPGGMASQTSKYFNSNRHTATNPYKNGKKDFSTLAAMASKLQVKSWPLRERRYLTSSPGDKSGGIGSSGVAGGGGGGLNRVSLQGVQGMDDDCCYKIWKENCIKYHLPNCDEQIQAVQSGRKTLEEIFEEQDRIIRQMELEYSKQGAAGVASKSEGDGKQLTGQQKLQQAVKDYGATVLVFHVTQCLAWLGLTYLAISSGLDVVGIMAKLALAESVLQSKLVTGGGTFVIAYAIYKVCYACTK
ncbi:PREDICTED: uncharacterized protein LOC106812782 [Priapulus caudatus]|uniref:Uncharacterized protein LOC106812782 n=1 Tax=Priapulus caudatus TaxID=37621 RepID=A0ABM1EJ74_PRICU|nr:PREDICTED: uncharacterized protein LOC106812782 [Priapulus caudatus]